MYYEEFLTYLAKTDPPITLFEHSSDVLQVLNYLIAQNANAVQAANVIRAGALTHDIGKIENDRRGGQWIHTIHSSTYLKPLLDDPRFQALLSDADVNIATLDRELLLLICEEHHNPSPKLLHRCKDAILVSVADALASSISAGMVGSITEILRSNPYMQINLELLKGLGFNKGFDSEFHHIDLPNQFTEDLFLANMIFRVLEKPLRESGVIPLVQKGSSLWVVGDFDTIYANLMEFGVSPKQLYDSVFDEGIYDSILAELPPAGSLQVDSIKYVLVNETIARKLAIAFYTRKSVRTLFEKYNLSYLVDNVDELFAEGLAQGIDKIWNEVRATVIKLEPRLTLPGTITSSIQLIADEQKDRASVAMVLPNEKFLESIKVGDKKKTEDIREFLKLFDASGNYYRSLTNILLEMLKMKNDIAKNTYNLTLEEVALLDGQSLTKLRPIKNSSLCPVCRRYPQENTATGLITGNPKMDSVYQTFRSTRSLIKVCRWCFLTGYVDLPIASISKEGQSISKKREYLFLTSPLSKDKLQRLVDFARSGRIKTTEDGIGEGGDEDQERPDEDELLELQATLGIASGYDQLAVLGVSRTRLSNLKGFALPTANILNNLVGIRIPFERLVGENKVSGAVRRELVKAIMYDLHLTTGSPSMHYNVVIDAPFSVEGCPLNIEDMRRSNLAYRIADRYARFGRYRQLNSGIFRLLISDTRKAITTILRTQRRENHGQYVPGEDRIKELIEMAESMEPKDWKFDLGLKIVGTLVEVGLLRKARSFRFGPGPKDVFTGIELVKWIQRFKMVRDDTTAHAWATMLLNALKRGDLAYKEFIEEQGGQISAPGEETIKKIIDLVDGEEGIIKTCIKYNCKLSELSREIAEMDYYLLFYYNQNQKVKGDTKNG